MGTFASRSTYMYVDGICNGDKTVFCEVQPQAEERVDCLGISPVAALSEVRAETKETI